MRIFDGFIFSDEVELLRLRLAIMGPHVDGFLVVEGDRTFTGRRRELQFPKLVESLPFREKIRYVPVGDFPATDSAWEREHFLRDQLRLNFQAAPDDLALIADVDEIVNIPAIREKYDGSGPVRIEIPCHYHFLDVQSSERIRVNLLSPFRHIENVPIGDRNRYAELAPQVIPDRAGRNGGHFTYIYGYAAERYVGKIRNFSHQELNTTYFTDCRRILKCVAWDLDLFERDQFHYRTVPLCRIFPDMAEIIRRGATTLPVKAGSPSPLGGLRRFGDPYYWRRQYHLYRYARARFKRRCLGLVGR